MSRLGSFKSWIILILVVSFLSPAINAIFDFLLSGRLTDKKSSSKDFA